MDFQRSLRILDPKHVEFPITIIGAGGIGSPTALILASLLPKLGFKDTSVLTVIDPDEAAKHNAPNQLLLGPNDYYIKKVDLLQKRVLELTGQTIRTFPVEFPSDKLPKMGGIVVSGVDSMKSRKAIWKNISWNAEVPLYIDGRTGVGPAGQWLQVHTVRPCSLDDIEAYERTLCDDAEADQTLACDAFIPVNLMVASHIGSQLQKWIEREAYYQTLEFDLKTLTLIRKEKRQPTSGKEENQ